MKLIVDASHEQNCFVYLNSKYCPNSQENHQCIQVQLNDRNIYFWAIYHSSVTEGCISINPLHSTQVGLALGQYVNVNVAFGMRNIDKVNIKVNSHDDEIILESNLTQVQRVILTQLRLVVADQKAVVWLSPSVWIVFTPEETGILVNHTQIFVKLIIAPMPANTSELQDNSEFERNRTYSFKTMKGLKHPLFREPKRLALRALDIEGDGKKDLIHPYTVFIHEDLIEEQFGLSHPILALIKTIPCETISHDNDGMVTWRHELCVEVSPVNSVVFRSLSREVYSEYIPTVLISKSLKKIINLTNGTMLTLTFIDSKSIQDPIHIQIMTYEKNEKSEHDLINKFIDFVQINTYAGKVFLINHDVLKVDKHIFNGYVKFRLFPDGLNFTTLTQKSLINCKISVKSLDKSDFHSHSIGFTPTVALDYDYKNYCRTIKPLEELLERVLSHVSFDINRKVQWNNSSKSNNNILIVGQHGAGKSAICNLVEKEISVFSYIVRCRPMKGRKDVLMEVKKALNICQKLKPALLMMDDLDDLVPACTEGMPPQEVCFINAAASFIKKQVNAVSGVSVLLTARSGGSLHPEFQVSPGLPMFTKQFNMPDLTQEDRVQLFQHIVNHRVREHFNVDVDDVIRLAMESSGYNITQILDAFAMKKFAATRRKAYNPDDPKPPLIVDVRKDVEKLNAFDVWEPVGGMEDVKQKFDACLFWPILYPALYPSQNCGILLYGPPGTGKSLIGSCLARLSSMSVITVKGPELLSKYIGQSEAAVREVFDKQDMKHPCIIFFDEFDSLAPKRGHDSTGVTDRVVNQLLARLDGAEGGARGPVIVATSRPDFLDPALLRAGRIATHIQTKLPSLDGRHAILRTLSKEFNLRPSVDLQWVAENTDGFSPADLKVLLVNAQLIRVDIEMIGRQVLDEGGPTPERMMIDQHDLELALNDTEPSLSQSQKRFYNFVYRRFRGEALNEEQNRREGQELQRVTLA